MYITLIDVRENRSKVRFFICANNFLCCRFNSILYTLKHIYFSEKQISKVTFSGQIFDEPFKKNHFFALVSIYRPLN